MPQSALPLRVGRSRTGLGLFAAAPIRRGTIIVEYVGKRISAAEAQARERRGARYIFELDQNWAIDGSARSNLARYINHACEPNAEAISAGGRIFIRALRTIRAGEEITFDYGRAYLDLFFGPDGCRCAACDRRRAGA
jgi:SET domain-containing protein